MPSPDRRNRLSQRQRPVLFTTVLATALALVLLAAQGFAPDRTSVAATTPWTNGSTIHGLTAKENPDGSRDLTLVTGDIVHVTESADGRHTATVTASPRPDGSTPGFWTHQDGEDLYVVPDDLTTLIPERLDPALFNVSQLLELGYADDQSSGLPVIVTFDPQSRSRARSAPPADDVTELESVNGLGMTLEGDDQTAAISAALDNLAVAEPRVLATGPYAGLDKVWLDRPVESTLAESVSQVGAPHAWEQGYDGTGVTVAVLDTGIDTDHPDLAEAVTEERNFSSSDSTDDRRGHGTHVASAIAGSGAASDAQYVGVAPGADLLNGKVLDDFGFGQTSDVIDAMEWAAEEGADVVNMSLGESGNYSDGTDPASLAVNALTEEHDMLFVIAAGNEGPRAGTVTAPASADRALTVASVDKNGDIAETSSRGPRGGDHALKPDISGPGVDIVAARADGTSLGMPVNDSYTSLGGTSMATPHVAGVAALVSQARPEIRGTQLKALLMSTAVPNAELGVLEEGAGRVDVRPALDGPVVTAPPSVHLGNYVYPHNEHGPAEQAVTYQNLGDQPVELDLSVTAQNADGQPAPEGALSISATTLTVPAGGTADVTLTLDPTVPGEGQFSGALMATTAAGENMRTPIGYTKEPERYNVRVEGVARDGRPAHGQFRVLDVEDGSVSASRMWGNDDDSCTIDDWSASNCIRVEPGTYSISGLVFTMPQSHPSTTRPAAQDAYLNTSVVAEPEITIDGHTTLTMDARAASEVQIETPDHDTKRNVGAARQVNIGRVTESGTLMAHGYLLSPRAQLEERIFLQPTDEVTQGELTAYTRWMLEAPAITFDVVEGAGEEGAVELDPRYYDRYWFSDNSWQFPQLEGSQRLRVVDAGTATASEVAELELDGALALVRRSGDVPVGTQAANAAGAGAAMVAVYNDVPEHNSDPGEPGIRLDVPTVRLSHTEGTDLQEQIGNGPVVVEATGTPVSPYRYNLVFSEKQQIPEDLRYVADTDDMAAVDNEFHSQLSDDATITEAWYAMPTWENFALSFPTPTVGAPRSRTDYYLADPDFEYGQRVLTPESRYNSFWPGPQQAQMQLRADQRSFDSGEQVERPWYQAPLRPGLWPSDSVVRSGDTMSVRLAAFTDGAGHVAEASSSHFEDGFTTLFQVYADGERIIESPVTNGSFEIPEDTAEFRFEYDVDNDSPWASLSTRTRSVWTFETEPAADGADRIEPLLTVDYEVDTDIQNRLPVPRERRGPHRIAFSVGHQHGAPEVPITDAELEVSYDSGETWRTLHSLTESADGQFTATLRASTPKESDGFLSLRISAEDAHGNSVEQEIVRAYALP